MKRNFIAFGLLVAAAFALTNCAQKESYAPVQEEAQNTIPFELVVNLPAETKTVNDGMHTKWQAGDVIKVKFVSKISDRLSSTYEFTTVNGDGVFTASLTSALGDIFATLKMADIKVY
jgi:hypothetical protein